MIDCFLSIQGRVDRLSCTLAEGQNLLAAGKGNSEPLLGLAGHLERFRHGSRLEAAQLESLGRAVAEAMLPGDLAPTLRRLVRRSQICLRLLLDPGLIEVPWTLAYLDEVGYLSLNPSVRFVYEAGGAALPRAAAKHGLRILVAQANPKSDEYPELLSADREFESIKAALESSENQRISVSALREATPKSLERVLQDGTFDLFHFIGHGHRGPTSGALVLEGGREGQAELVYADEAGSMLAERGLTLAVLSCCHGAGDAGSVGLTLAEGGLPFVIAMLAPISDTSAHLFSRAFYAALSDGFTVSDSHYQGVSAIRAAGQDWASPALLTRWPQGVLLRDAGQPENTRGNLPVSTSSFIGRASTIREVADAVRGGQRLTVLHGSGGIGKTRLSLEIARSLAPTRAHGVWQIALENVFEPAGVWEAIGRPFGLREGGTGDLAERVLDFLAGQEMLLVFDNCEQVIDACREAALSILARGPGVSILATSREVFGTPAEVVVRVEPLSFPVWPAEEPLGLSPAEALRDFEAIQLFTQRGRSAMFGFELTQENIETVSRIVRRVDGIPLAIELAASRLRSFTPQQILERLIADLGWLDLENPGAVPRHKTLRATLDSSYRLLSDSERTLFDRLSVFVASFSLDDARIVGGADPLSEAATPEILSRLVDKALVTAKPVHGEMRYQLLDTCRRYAGEKLAAKEDREDAYARLLNRGCENATEYYRQVVRGLHTVWLITSDDYLANALAALEWAVGEGNRSEEAVPILTGYFMYLYAKGDLALGNRLAETILTALPRDNTPEWAMVTVLAGSTDVYLGRPSGLDRLRTAYQWASEHCPEMLVPNSTYQVSVIPFLVDCAYMLADDDLTEEAGYKLLEWASANGNEGRFEKMTLGNIALERGDFERAEGLFDSLLRALEERGDRKATGMAMCHLAYLSWKRGSFAYREQFVEGIRRLASDTNHYFFAGYLMLASLALAEEDPTNAARLQGFATRLREESGAKMDRYVDGWGWEICRRTQATLGDGYQALANDGRTMSLEIALSLLGITPQIS